MRDEDKWWYRLLYSNEGATPFTLPPQCEAELVDTMVTLLRHENGEFPEFTDDLDFFDHAEVIG